MKEKEKKVEELIKTGRINLMDIDRDEDLMWALGDLWCLEKHLNQALNKITLKLKEDPNNEYNKKLFELISNVLNQVRIERTKHLKNIQKLHEFALWCSYKHLLGIMMQFGEVGAKELYIGITNKNEENIKRAKECFETSNFAHDIIILFNKFAKKYKGVKNGQKV